MRIAITYSPWLLSHRGGLDLDGYRDDPRGLSGSEMCAVRLYEEFCNMPGSGPVWLYTDVKRPLVTQTAGIDRWEKRTDEEWDVAISINCPDDLRGMRAKKRVCYTLLNDFTFCQAGFEEHVDLFVSPSQPHLDQCLTNPNWRRVEQGKAEWNPSSKPWAVVPLGCDPERYQGHAKVPGRVVYTSSPDRGLHWLLQEWPAIRRAVPHATLRIFYRTTAWLRTFDNTPYFPEIEGQRRRALYIEEALRRLKGHGVELFDSVSRATLEKELGQAEVFAYPCDPDNEFTEGFSCSTLEACAARACPVITDADALGSIYSAAVRVQRRGEWGEWSRDVIRALVSPGERRLINERAYAFAQEHTWKATATKLMAAIR